MTKEEIHQIQGDTIHKTTIIVDSIIEATVMILKKTTTANIIHYAKDNIRF